MHSPKGLFMTPKIVYFPKSDTYVIRKNSYFDDNILIRGNVIIGIRTTFWKNLCVLGSVRAGKGCLFKGNVMCTDGIISGDSVIEGTLESTGNISVFRNVRIGAAISGGHLTIMDGCVVGYASSRSGELELIGTSDIRAIDRGTKVTVRSDAVLPEDPEEEQESPEIPDEEQDSSGIPDEEQESSGISDEKQESSGIPDEEQESSGIPEEKSGAGDMPEKHGDVTPEKSTGEKTAEGDAVIGTDHPESPDTSSDAGVTETSSAAVKSDDSPEKAEGSGNDKSISRSEAVPKNEKSKKSDESGKDEKSRSQSSKAGKKRIDFSGFRKSASGSSAPENESVPKNTAEETAGKTGEKTGKAGENAGTSDEKTGKVCENTGTSEKTGKTCENTGTSGGKTGKADEKTEAVSREPEDPVSEEKTSAGKKHEEHLSDAEIMFRKMADDMDEGEIYR